MLREIMSNELMTVDALKYELLVMKHQQEIQQLKNDLDKVQAEKASRLENSLYSPKLFEHYLSVAVQMSKSKMIPTIYQGKPDDIFVAMAYGYQLGFPIEQALQDIAVVNGRPCLWGDGLLAVVMTHPDFIKHTETPVFEKDSNECIGYNFTVFRKGHDPHTVMFTRKDAETAKLWSKPGAWATNPNRMMQLRARAFGLRDKFPDALRGIRQAEVERDEPNDFIEGEVVDNAAKNILEAMKAQMQAAPQDEKVNDSTGSQTTTQEAEKPSKKAVTHEQLKAIRNYVATKEITQDQFEKIYSYFKVDDFSQLEAYDAERLISRLSKYPDKQGEVQPIEMKEEIDGLLAVKKVTKEQLLKLMDNYNVSDPDNLTKAQAIKFIAELNGFDDK